MKKVKTTESVGHVLCHDLTQIIPGIKQDVAFKKGHIVTEQDIPVLLSMGKEHLYIWEKKEGMVHEDDAAYRLLQLCENTGMQVSEVKEGKITLYATVPGLLKVNSEKLNRINAIGEIIIAGRHGNFPVYPNEKICSMRVIPLIIEEEKLNRAKEIAGNEPLFEILPFEKKKAYIITTGSEVYSGKIKDAFGPKIKEKLKEYHIEVLGQDILDDDPGKIKAAINKAKEKGADFILCTGGMSVDPDDTTPTAIQMTGAKIVTYGAPVLPGAMFLLAYDTDDNPIVGLPGCVMYNERTIFDLVLPRLLAGEKLKKEDLTNLGEGGLCLGCEICHFPNCGFGK